MTTIAGLPATTLPPFFSYQHRQLMVEGVSLGHLAREHGTPLFVYSRAAMLSALAAYQRGLAGRQHLICYAMKANSSLAILQTLVQAGCGLDIVSGGELERALAAGVEPSKIIFSGVGKTRAEMRQALTVGIGCFNVESRAELDVLDEVARSVGLRAPVSVRVNPNVDAQTHPYISTGLKGNKFGIAHEDVLSTYRHAAACDGLRVVGIDCHIGSQITQTGPYLDAMDRVLDLVENIEAAGVPIEHIDFGGGLGIDYQGDNPPEADALWRALLQHRARPLAGRQRGRLPHRGAVPQTRRAEELPDRGRGHERPAAPGDVPGLPPHRAGGAAHRWRCRGHLGCGGPGVRERRLDRTRPHPCGAERRLAGRALGRCVLHEHGQQLQHTRPCRGGAGGWRDCYPDPRT
jgi:hypothetical protein